MFTVILSDTHCLAKAQNFYGYLNSDFLYLVSETDTYSDRHLLADSVVSEKIQV